MDLETENSAVESTADNDVVCSANPLIGDGVKIGLNGSCEQHDDGSNGNGHKLSCDRNGEVKLPSESDSLQSNLSSSGECVGAVTAISSDGKGSENDNSVLGSPLSPPNILPGSPRVSPPTSGTKGKGLKKWRRIRRDVTKDTTVSLDVTKVLKRGSENFLNSSEVAPEMKQKSEGSMSSTNALIDNTVGADTFSMDGPNSNYEGIVGSTFSVGADSDNSKDRSSKSSTAASAPRHRHDPSRVSGHSREKQRMKHIVGKSPVSASQRLQQGAFQVSNNKKSLVEAVNMDKENSYSSLDSDSRSYTVFRQGSSSVMNNGHGERIMGYDSEHGYDPLTGEQYSVDGPPAGSNKTLREIEEFSQSDAASSWQVRGRNENDELSRNGDPIIDSLTMLMSVKEALVQEIQKFSELGKDILPVDYNSVVSSNWAISKDAAQGDQAVEEKNIELEKKLEQTFTILKEKESRIVELEAAFNDVKQSNEDLRRSAEMQQQKLKESETHIENLLKEKTEAELKFIAVEDMRLAVEKQVNLLKLSPIPQAKTDDSLTREEISMEIRKKQRKVAKSSSCFLIQLILLIVVLNLFISQLLPMSEIVMPT